MLLPPVRGGCPWRSGGGGLVFHLHDHGTRLAGPSRHDSIARGAPLAPRRASLRKGSMTPERRRLVVDCARRPSACCSRRRRARARGPPRRGVPLDLHRLTLLCLCPEAGQQRRRRRRCTNVLHCLLLRLRLLLLLGLLLLRGCALPILRAEDCRGGERHEEQRQHPLHALLAPDPRANALAVDASVLAHAGRRHGRGEVRHCDRGAADPLDVPHHRRCRGHECARDAVHALPALAPVAVLATRVVLRAVLELRLRARAGGALPLDVAALRGEAGRAHAAQHDLPHPEVQHLRPMPVHHLLRHAAAQGMEVDKPQRLGLPRLHGLRDILVHDLEVFVVPEAVRPRNRLDVATEFACSPIRGTEGVEQTHRLFHVGLEDADGGVPVHLEQLFPGAVLGFDHRAHIVPSANLDYHGHRGAGPSGVALERVHSQVQPVPEEAEEHGDPHGAIVVCGGLVEHPVHLREACRRVRCSCVLVRLLADWVDVVHSGPMHHLAILDDYVDHGGGADALPWSIDVILVRGK
mmetsp:Transcript_20029/g.58159  ORF Transcript_20029/g.58159 Transcript_20029/m.58159 type:complete len:522 (-) Transcript_20029:784-2349(-)